MMITLAMLCERRIMLHANKHKQSSLDTDCHLR